MKHFETRYQKQSDREFDEDSFLENTIRPFFSHLIEEIETAFNIPDNLKGFTVLDPNSIPLTVGDLHEFGIDGIESLGHFYGGISNQNPGIIDQDALSPQYQAFKTFVLKNRIDYETKQEEDLIRTCTRLKGEQSKLATLSSILTKRKKIKIEKNIKILENEKDSLSKEQKYSFEIMFAQWMGSD